MCSIAQGCVYALFAQVIYYYLATFPTFVEPVKETLATLSLSQMVSPTIDALGLLQVIRLNSPAGTPPCDNSYKTG